MHCSVATLASCLHLCASVTKKQYNLVLVKAGVQTGTPGDALASYPWSHSISWCLAKGYRNGDQRQPMGPRGLARSVLFFTYLQICIWPC